MPSVSENVRVAVSGAVSVGPTATVAPTTAISVLPAGFVDLGFISEDGVVEKRDRSSNTIKAWQNAAIVREVVTEANLTFTFTMIETKKETVELFYGATVNATDGGFVVVPASTGGRKSFVIDAVDGTSFIRTYIPQGEVVEVGEVVYVSGEPVGYEVTIRAYPDAGISGSARKWYSALDTVV